MKKKTKRSIGILFGIGLAYIFLLISPSLLFSYTYKYQNFQVYADELIPTEIEEVLKDVDTRLKGSDLYEASDQFKIFICNEDWRFSFFTRNPKAGGVVNFGLSPNIFIRQSDIKKNRIIPPDGWMFAANERPLSYFIAHEATHSLQRKIDPLLNIKNPVYIIEGYADYIGKGKDFDFKKYKQRYIEGHPTMNPANGLYSKYHLYIAYLMEKKNYSFLDIVKEQPDLESVLKELVED